MTDRKQLPVISIITPTLNRADLIETAIQSVLDQHYPNVEHIIIDGGSTDGTLEVLSKYPQLKIVSEPDKGMYDALNKGIALATGEIIGILNSDDYYAPKVFTSIAQYFSGENVDAVAGQVGIANITKEIMASSITHNPGNSENLIKHSILEPPYINSYFFTKSVFQRIGLFDTQYKIASDRDFMLRFALGHFKIVVVDDPVYFYLQHSGSMTIGYTENKFRKMVDEHLLLSKNYIESLSEYPNLLLRSFVEMRTRDTIRVCAHCIRQMKFGQAMHYAKEGFRYNPFWIFRFLKHSLIHPIRQKLGFPYKSP